MKLKTMYYKLLMDLFGNRSMGIYLAKTYGLNSAEVMEYIYRNNPTPRGKGIISTYADSLFLNYPTWQAIRMRKLHLENAITSLLQGFFAENENRTVRILDLASGYGQYIFASLDMYAQKSENIYVEMRDTDLSCRNIIEKRNQNKNYNINFIQSDILKDDSFDFNSEKFDIIILSGFFDSLSFYRTGVIASVMERVEKLLSDSGYFIFTYQISHEDAEMVNQLFTDTKHNKLNIGEKPIDVMNELVEAQQFKITDMKVDNKNRYAVATTAKKNAKIPYSAVPDGEIRILKDYWEVQKNRIK